MKYLLIIATLFLTTVSFADTWYTQGNANLGVSKKVKCGVNMVCTKSSGQVTVTAHPIVSLSTNATLTASQCGSTVINSAAAVATLPEASTVLGCRFSFVTANASNFDVNPADASDQIQVLTNAAGDAIRNATLGNSITLMAVSANGWVAVGKEQGTYSDVN